MNFSSNQWLVTLKMFLDGYLNMGTSFVGTGALIAEILILNAKICTHLETKLWPIGLSNYVEGKLRIYLISSTTSRH